VPALYVGRWEERGRETERVVRRGRDRERDRGEKSLVDGSFDWWRAREGLAWYL
jgi:hypothetical protein